MAAPRQVWNRSVQREEAGGSAESSVATRTPVPAVSPGSPERLVSPAQVAEPPGKNLWEQICEEYEAELPTLPKGYKVKQGAAVTVSSGTPMEEVVTHGFNMEHYLPGHPFPVLSPEPCPPMKAVTVEPKTCSSKDYLEMFIFPVLLPGMANLLHQAKREKCFERKRTKFIGCDFLTEWLYNQNPKRAGEPFTEFFSIPFVEKWLEHHPRPPIPLSLLLTEEEAAISIQSFWRAYLVRCDPEIQELRQWQKKLREDNHIRQRVKIFWAKQEQKISLYRMEPAIKVLTHTTVKGVSWMIFRMSPDTQCL
ncbi:IQ domain-containing protein K isoform X2 [Mesocricetus auratus]|uniref:IQ domain-containing protein K isoform X2 n=1 Tax=Mesocricetus auratus TaxID=10036 RepID=A0ABM2Y9S6_MESAU|nr:IQ domain-containing protein K isoform X2 [Mesocricetus auratus]